MKNAICKVVLMAALLASLFLQKNAWAQWNKSFALGVGFCKLDISGSTELRNNKSSYVSPVAGLGLEYKFNAPFSIALMPTYAYLSIGGLYNKPYYTSGFGETYRYFFEVHALNVPLQVSYYTHADDEKSWVFSAGAGLSFMGSFSARAQQVITFGPFAHLTDTTYNVKELSPGNMNTVVTSSITKKFKTKRSIKPYLSISYSFYTDPWRFEAINARTSLFFMRPHFINFSLGFTIKNQPVRRPPGAQTILQESK